jgi:hypothetical protein
MIETVVHDKGWNPTIETKLSQIEKKCEKLIWCHVYMSNQWRNLDRYLHILVLLISSLTGTIISYFSGAGTQSEINVIGIIASVVLYITAFLNGTILYFNPALKKSLHDQSSASYSDQLYIIQRQLAINKNDRENSKDFYYWIIRNDHTLLTTSPQLYKNVLKKYETEVASNIEALRETLNPKEHPMFYQSKMTPDIPLHEQV